MESVIEAQGGCLCGAVQFSAATVSTQVHACHCATCRKWTGGPLLAVDCKDSLKIQGEENISLYSSSEWAERGFCSKCGTNLFYHLHHGNRYIVPADLFDTKAKFVLESQIFIDEKPDYYDFANETEKLTAAQVFAQHSGD